MTNLHRCIIHVNCNEDLADQGCLLRTISIGWQTWLLLTVKLSIMLKDVRVAKHCIYTCMQQHSIPSDGPDRGDGEGATGAVELALPVGS